METGFFFHKNEDYQAWAAPVSQGSLESKQVLLLFGFPVAAWGDQQIGGICNDF